MISTRFFPEYEFIGTPIVPGMNGDLDLTNHTLILPDSSMIVKSDSGSIVGWRIFTTNTNTVHLSVWEPVEQKYA